MAFGSPKYKGLVLFDIDDTLSTNSYVENFLSVDYCIKNNYAVGICTAGAYYTPENLNNFRWMPLNLSEFLRKTNNKTFNNVARGYICNNDSVFQIKRMLRIVKEANVQISDTEMIGFIKGYAAAVTAGLIGGINSYDIYLLDNDPNVITGFKKFNPVMNAIPAGNPAGTQFNLNTLTTLF